MGIEDEPEEGTDMAEPGYDTVYKREPLPWVLFAATLVVFIVTTLFLVNRVNTRDQQFAEAAAAQALAESRAKDAAAEFETSKQKVTQLEGELKTSEGQREILAQKLNLLEAKNDQPKKATVPPPPAGAKKRATAPPPPKKRK